MEHSKFYHAGCAKCIVTEQELLNLMDPSMVDIINLSENRNRVEEAIHQGVKSVPALVTPNGAVLHINYSMSVDEISQVVL